MGAAGRPWRRAAGAARRRLRARRRRREAWLADPHVVALELVRRAERSAPSLPRRRRPRTFGAQGRALLPADAPEAVTPLLPPLPTPSLGAQVVRAPVAADAVVLAKFALTGATKLRAAYVGAGLTLSVDGSGSQERLARIVRSHEVVGAVDPELMPRLVGHGSLADGSCYLVESWVAGTPLTTSQALGEAAPELLRRLRRVHLGHGVEQLALGEWWLPHRRAAWQATVETGLVPAPAVAAVGRLLGEPDRTVSVSWCHGDLVASNVMRTDEGPVLVDWERAGVAPVMRDAARLHLFSSDPPATLAAVHEAWRWEPHAGELGRGEQLVLAHAQELSGYAARRAALVGHPRAQIYERQSGRTVDRLLAVLSQT